MAEARYIPKPGDVFRFFTPSSHYDMTTPKCLCIFSDDKGVLYESAEGVHGHRRWANHPLAAAYVRVSAGEKTSAKTREPAWPVEAV